MLNKLTKDVSIDGVVVIFEEVSVEEKPSDDGALAAEGETANRLGSDLVPRACAISMNISW